MRTNFSANFFGLFAIFDLNFVKLVAPPTDKNENYVEDPKELSILKKWLKTASKSTYKRQRNACPNYAPLEQTARRPRSVTKKLQN